MNHGRIKWVFIILFLLINVFMGYLLYQFKWNETGISEEGIDHAVSVLEQRNVLVEKELIPRNNHKMREVSVKNIVEGSSSFVAALKEDGWKTTSSGFLRGGDVIELSAGSFEYRGQLPLEKELSGEKLSQEVKKQLPKLHLNIEGMKLKIIEQMADGVRLDYVQTYEEYEIFGTKLTVFVKDGIITKIVGVWTESVNIQSKRQETLFATEALIRFATQNQSASPIKITEIRTGYYINELDQNVSHKVMQMLPGFQITTATGDKFYYDARSPRQ